VCRRAVLLEHASDHVPRVEKAHLDVLVAHRLFHRRHPLALPVAQVSLHLEHGGSREAGLQLGHRLVEDRLLARDEDDAEALREQPARELLADPARRAGDKRPRRAVLLLEVLRAEQRGDHRVEREVEQRREQQQCEQAERRRGGASRRRGGRLRRRSAEELQRA